MIHDNRHTFLKQLHITHY